MYQKHYLLVKAQEKERETDFCGKTIEGLSIKPRNHVKYEGITVKKLYVLDKDFIVRLLKRKIKIKLDMYFNYLITYLEEGGEDGTTDLRHALNDLTRYKSIIKNKYQKFLDTKYIHLLQKKIEMLDKEIQTKLMYFEMAKQYEQYYGQYGNYMGYQDEFEQSKGKSR